MKRYFWAVIMDYLRNPSLKLKLSVNYPNTGIIIAIEKPHKITNYIFEVMDVKSAGNKKGRVNSGNNNNQTNNGNTNKWNFKYWTENAIKLPE